MDFPNLIGEPYVVIDAETTGLSWHTARIFGVAISTVGGFHAYYDVRNQNERDYVQDVLFGVPVLVAHHAKFEMHHFRESGFIVDGSKWRCTMVAAALLNEHELSYSLDKLARQYCGIGKDEPWEELSKLFGGRPTKDAQITNLHRAPRALQERYATQDTRATLALWQYQQPKLEEEGLGTVWALECALMGVLVRMEQHGVKVDLDRANRNAAILTARLEERRTELKTHAGFDLNINSNKQLQKVLVKDKIDDRHFAGVDGTIIDATDAGAPSLGAETLRKMTHLAAKLIIEIRGLDKTINTFLKGHILGHHVNGRVHTTFNQTKSDNDAGTGTGRLSSTDPALQQIHKRDKVIAALVRACFIPDADQTWCCHDWSQMDFRMFSHYTREDSILAAYAADPDTDYHTLVGQITGLPRDRTPGTGGGNAKQINLGLVFGMSAGRMAKEMGLDYTEEIRRGRGVLIPSHDAVTLFEKYHAAIPGVRRLLDKAASLARSRGYVKTILGRKIRFPAGAFHKAAGLVFQGSAADALKVKLVEMDALLEGTGGKLLLNVHDEFDSSLPPNSDPLIQRMTTCLQDFESPHVPIRLRVPIRASNGTGDNWWEASK